MRFNQLLKGIFPFGIAFWWYGCFHQVFNNKTDLIWFNPIQKYSNALVFCQWLSKMCAILIQLLSSIDINVCLNNTFIFGIRKNATIHSYGFLFEWTMRTFRFAFRFNLLKLLQLCCFKDWQLYFEAAFMNDVQNSVASSIFGRECKMIITSFCECVRVIVWHTQFAKRNEAIQII